MKKLMILAAAVVAMAACTKSEVVYNDTAEIGIYPVNYLNTKAVPGPISSTTYPTGESFNVFAQYTSSATGTQLQSAQNLTDYIPNGKFTKQNLGDKWAGDPNPYYWPKTGSLYFAGYSPSEATVGTASYSFTEYKLTLSKFEQKGYTGTTNNGGMDDLMYFDVESTTTSVNSNDVAAPFKHALSWLDFNIKCTSDLDNSSITIKSVTLQNVYHDGKFESGASPAWDFTSLDTEDLTLLSGGSSIVKSTQALELKNVLVIPQTIPLAASNSNDYTLTIAYSMQTPAGQAIDQVANADLTGRDVAGTGSTTAWLINMHYTYNITIGLDEILIAPTVAEWQTRAAGDIDIEAE